MTWLGVPVLDWLILAIALGLGVEAWLTTRPTPEERAAAARAREPDGGAATHHAAKSAACATSDAVREDRDHPSN